MILELASLGSIALRNALFVSLAVLAVLAAIRLFKLRSTRLQQWLWVIALVPGACLLDVYIRMPISLPTPMASKWQSNAHSSRLIGKGQEKPGTVLQQVASTGQQVDEDDSPGSAKYRRSGTEPLAAAQSVPVNRSFDRFEPIEKERLARLPKQGQAGLHDFDSSSKPERSRQTVTTAPDQVSWSAASRSVPVWIRNLLPHLPAVLAVVWLAGGVVLLLRYFLQWTLLQVQLREATSAPSAWQLLWRRVLGERKLDRPIRLLRHSNLGPFLTVTPLGAVVVIPDDYWEELTECERRAVLRHELRHYERGDLWLSAAADLLLLLQWFNPLAWLARRNLDDCIELNCDQQSTSGEQDRTAFAKALLKLVEFPSFPWAGVKGAKSSLVGNRIRHLLLPPGQRDSRWLQFGAVASTILVASLVLIRFEAVAKQLPGESEDGVSQAENSGAASPSGSRDGSESAVEVFANRLDLQNDATGKLKSLAEALQTQAGMIVAQERAAEFENQLRLRAEAEPIPRILRAYFDQQQDGRFVLKPNQLHHAEKFAKDCQVFESDTKNIAELLKSMASRIAGSDETSQLIGRFLTDPISATIVYCQLVQAKIRPDYQDALEQLKDYFVVNRQGKLIPRPGSAGASSELLQKLERVHRIATRVRRDLAEWSSDLSQKHPLSNELREAMNHPSYAIQFALDHVDDDYAIDRLVEDFFENLEYMFHDQADGLVPKDEEEQTWREHLGRLRTLRIVGERWRPILAQVAANLEVIDETSRRWQKLMQSDLFAYWLVAQMQLSYSDAKANVEEYLREFLSENSEGKLAVNPDRQEELQEMIRQWFREGRSMRRRGAEIAAFADKLADAKLSTAYKSTAGKSLVLRWMRSELAREYFDGWGAWVDEHFERTDDGYLLKEGHESEVDAFVERTKEIEKESANRDF